MDNSTRDYLDSPQIAAKYGMIIISDFCKERDLSIKKPFYVELLNDSIWNIIVRYEGKQQGAICFMLKDDGQLIDLRIDKKERK